MRCFFFAFELADFNTLSILCTLSFFLKVLGDAFFNAHYAAFDFVNNRVGFAHLAENSETICADDWEVDITNVGQPMPPATTPVVPPPPAPVPKQPQPVPPATAPKPEPAQPFNGGDGGGGILPEGSSGNQGNLPPQPPEPSPWSSAASLPGYKSPASPSSSPPSSSSSSSMLGVGVAFLAIGVMAMAYIMMRRQRRNARYRRAQHFNEMDTGDDVELPGML